MNTDTNPTPSAPVATTSLLGSGRRRTGKVARLPKQVRDRISQMLHDGRTYPKILEAIGDDARHLTEMNISSWKKGGYQDWLRENKENDLLRLKYDLALKLVNGKEGDKIHQATVQVAAANMIHLLVDLDPSSHLEALQKSPQNFLRLLNVTARLADSGIKSECHDMIKSAHALQVARQKSNPGTESAQRA
jgi:hypothetical protein